ncbi:MAG: hypothetical protein JXO48_07100 [Deltaproteobacteria bacterium]|nr:hypothetical protein [Deltaproteobacteria bacterium]
MPIYEYQCRKCGHIMSVIVRGFDDPKGLACESCGAKGPKRIISAVNYHASQADRLRSYKPGASKNDAFYKDTRNIGLDAERMLKKAGIEPTEEFKSKLDNIRSDPSKVLKDYTH